MLSEALMAQLESRNICALANLLRAFGFSLAPRTHSLSALPLSAPEGHYEEIPFGLCSRLVKVKGKKLNTTEVMIKGFDGK